MRIVSWGIAVTLLLSLFWATGCSKPVDYMTPERLDQGLVFSLDGVGGYNWGPRWLRKGLDEGGVKSGICIFSWGHGPAGMFVADIWDTEGNQRRAAELAALIENYQRSYPGRPVYLVGHSGGAGMVVFALEKLKPGCQVNGAFLLAPALDPQRNLAPALRHVRRYCFTTYSPADVPLMGLGTSLFATMDGKHTVSAGLVGFRMPENLSAADRKEYAKMRQAGWSKTFLKKGHLGGHMDWSSTTFAREFLAPIMLGKKSSPAFEPLGPGGRGGVSSRASRSAKGKKG